MKEEIFGPILPMISYSKIEEAIDIIANRPKPLALYLFTEDSHLEKRILQNLSFGGATINDTLKHFINPNLPFGGIGLSGMNHYHGKETFNAFNHQKSVVKSSTKVKVNLQFFPSKKETL
jgi:aldehyde dehydrogenase (NAD+)